MVKTLWTFRNYQCQLEHGVHYLWSLFIFLEKIFFLFTYFFLFTFTWSCPMSFYTFIQGRMKNDSWTNETLPQLLWPWEGHYTSKCRKISDHFTHKLLQTTTVLWFGFSVFSNWVVYTYYLIDSTPYHKQCNV